MQRTGSTNQCCNVGCAITLSFPLPGRGRTAERWQLLADIAAEDLCVAKFMEAHYDAQAICADLAVELIEPGQRWAVWAAEPPGSDMRFTGNTLEGTKAWRPVRPRSRTRW